MSNPPSPSDADKRIERERELVQQLREESSEVKDCFTNFAFQVIALSAVGIGLIARFQPSFPLLGVASVAIILLALSVGRIGTYKYATANRHYGFELLLERAKHLKDTAGWKADYLDIGWEEALRAWRTVQPTVFRHYYVFGSNRANRLKSEHKNLKYPWFLPKRLHVEGAVYYAGSYLRTMLSILFVIVGFGMLSLGTMAAQCYYEFGLASGLAATLFSFGVACASAIKGQQLAVRRHLLEEGILSIHSCAIMWQLILIAHHRAIASLPTFAAGKVESLEGYTTALSKQALDLTKFLGDSPNISDWIQRRNG